MWKVRQQIDVTNIPWFHHILFTSALLKSAATPFICAELTVDRHLQRKRRDDAGAGPSHRAEALPLPSCNSAHYLQNVIAGN